MTIREPKTQFLVTNHSLCWRTYGTSYIHRNFLRNHGCYYTHHTHANITPVKVMVMIASNLSNYFRLHACLSLPPSVNMSNFRFYHQRPYQCVPGKAELHMINLKPRPLCNAVLGEARWNQATYNWQSRNLLKIFDFRVSSPPRNWSQAVMCVSTPRMYLQNWYLLPSVLKLWKKTKL